ncbi:MAG: FecR domain-containing protein [Cyclobacteriaceae bacterium]
MDLNSNDIEREEVLYRYFQKELTSEERTDVEAWRDASQENQDELEKARMMYLDLKGLAFYKSVNLHEVDRSWELFKKDKKIKSIHQASTSSLTWLKYAASIVLLVSTAFAIYYYSNSVEEITLASANEVREVTLSDGSLVALNQQASIEYLEPFQNNERRIKLTGEAYFEVTKRQEQPFVVEIGDTEVRVLGTKFFIHQSSTNELSVQVEEGKVLISHNDIHEIAEEGQQFMLNLENETLIETADETGISSFWKNRRLVFQVTSLEDVVAVVNEAYGSSIQLEGSTEGCSLTVTFENEDFENVLEVISSTLNYELVESQGSYILKGTGCE